MQSHIRLKKHFFPQYKFKNKKKIIIIMLIILLTMSIVLLFKIVDKKINPILLSYAELESKKLSSAIINKSIASNISNDLNIESLFIMTKDSTDEIKTIDFNPITVNKILTKTTEVIHESLKKLEKGDIETSELSSLNYSTDNNKLKKGVIFEIPSGILFSNSLLSNIGPKIPVKLNLVGDIVSNIKTVVTNYGINNALVEVRLSIELTQQVILPLTSKQIKIETSIPLALKLIQGTVPQYYSGSISESSPNLSIPIE